MKEAKSITIVADREADIYQLWSRIPDEKTHLVVRSSLMRVFKNDQGERIDPTDATKWVGQIILPIPADSDKKRKARQANIQLYVQTAWTRRPPSLNSTGDSPSIPLNVVVAREVPNGIEDPIDWILLTDIKANTLQDAITIISLYKSRWNIEQIFRLTKHKGFQLESSQLETGHAIENLIAMVLIAAIRIFQMVKSREDQHRPALDLFDDQEMSLLTQINKGLQGNSSKSVAFAIWIIARLGNWKPEDKDPPGPITMLNGWIVLQNYLKINRIVSG